MRHENDRANQRPSDKRDNPSHECDEDLKRNFIKYEWNEWKQVEDASVRLLQHYVCALNWKILPTALK